MRGRGELFPKFSSPPQALSTPLLQTAPFPAVERFPARRGAHRRSCRVCGFPSSVLAGAAPQGVPVSGDLLALSAFQPCVVFLFCTKANRKSRRVEYKSKKRARRNFEKVEGAPPDLTQKREERRTAPPQKARKAARAQGRSRGSPVPALACSARIILKKTGRKKSPAPERRALVLLLKEDRREEGDAFRHAPGLGRLFRVRRGGGQTAGRALSEGRERGSKRARLLPQNITFRSRRSRPTPRGPRCSAPSRPGSRRAGCRPRAGSRPRCPSSR